MNLQIDKTLVEKLISQQFPTLNGLPVKPIEKQGWDNRTFRLGDDLAVRLPSSQDYASAVQKEASALSALQPHLSVEIPEVVQLGKPSDDYPLPWSIRRWITGQTLENAKDADRNVLAKALGEILVELRSAPTSGGISAGKHSFFRGCHPDVYGDEVTHCLDILSDQIDTRRCHEIWRHSMISTWTQEPAWFHGDMSVGNILMNGNILKSVIDFGTCGIGDPACDLVMAWTYFDTDERRLFRKSAKVDDGTWDRAKGWALWKALVSLAGLSSPDNNGMQAHALSEIQNEGP